MRKIKISVRVIFVITIFLSWCGFAHAQQEPQYTNYMFNQLPTNPAFAGAKARGMATVLSRLQWVGIQGSPTTNTFAFHSPIPRARMGLGLTVVSDKLGPVENLGVNIVYAYHLHINKVNRLGFGLSAGFTNFKAGLNGVPLNPGTPVDPAFAATFQNNFQPNVGAGLYYYGGKLTLGLSTPKILTSKIAFNQNGQLSEGNSRQHYYFLAGYVFRLNEDFNFRPGLFQKIVTGSVPSTDLTAQFTYQELIWLGATYRVGDAVAGLLAIQATSSILLGYSYDYSANGLNGYNNGTHEVFLTYTFKFPKKNPCEVEGLFNVKYRMQKKVKNPKPLNSGGNDR